jgi:hypothetical protein
MAEEFEIPEDTLLSEDVGESVEESMKAQTELTDAFRDTAESADKATREKQIKVAETKVIKANTEILNKINIDVNGKPVSDPSNLETFNNDVSDLTGQDISDPQTIAKGKAAEAELTTENKKLLDSVNKSNAKVIKENILKSIDSSLKNDLQTELDNNSKLGQQLSDEINKQPPDQAKIKELSDKYSKSQKNIQDIFDKDTKLKTKLEGKDSRLGKIAAKILGVLGILSAIGVATWVSLKIMSDSMTGCYIYYNSSGVVDSYLLNTCNSYYDIEENNSKCSCPNKVPIGSTGLSNDQCTNLNSPADCTAPYCIGRCLSPPGNPTCGGFPSGQNLQCTTGTIADTGFVSYSYQKYTPLGLIGDGINLIGNLPGDIANDFSKLFKGILFYGGIILGGLIVLLILWVLFKKFILKE